MKTPGLKFGTAISLLVHLALLQGLVLAGVSGEPEPVESEVIVVELALSGPELGEGAAVTAEPVSKSEPPSAAVAPAVAPPVKAKPRIEKKQSVKAPSMGEREPEAATSGIAQEISAPVADTTTARGRLAGARSGAAVGGGDGFGLVRAGYGSQLASWLNRFKQYPALARRRGIEGDAKVRLVIERSGALLSSSLHEASGSTLLDESALAMVKAASPFPRVPDELSGERFEFEVPVAFRLR